MTFDQLQKFADSKDDHIRQVALTREGARRLLAEHVREIENVSMAPRQFEPTDRDDGKFAMQTFGRIGKVHETERLLFESTGLRTTAGIREADASAVVSLAGRK